MSARIQLGAIASARQGNSYPAAKLIYLNIHSVECKNPASDIPEPVNLFFFGTKSVIIENTYGKIVCALTNDRLYEAKYSISYLV